MEINQGRVLDALPAMAWTALPDGHIDFVNRRWSEYTGLGLEEDHGWEWPAIVEPGDLPKLRERWRSILASGEPADLEMRMRRFDGQYRWHVVQCNPLHGEAGHIIKWCGVATDVEDLRRSDEALRRRQLDFQSIVDSIPIPVAVTSPSGEVEGLNQLTLDYFGKTFDQLKGWKASDVVHPDDLEYTVATQLEAHRTGSPYSVESRHLRSDGVYRWYNVHGLPLRDPHGQILRWLHLLIDIGDRKQAEDALRESERYARLIVDSIPAGVSVLKPTGEVEAVNRHILEYCGKTEEEFKQWGTAAVVHPDDFQRVTETVVHSITTGEPYDIEQRLRGADGRYRWFQVRGLPLRGADGRILRWYALHIDIDEKKHAEQALVASERESRAILDSIPARVGVYDINGARLFTNKPAAQLGEFSEDSDWRDIYHPDDLQPAEDRWRVCLETETPFEFEYRARMADGLYRWRMTRRVPMRDENGIVIRWYGVSHDIEDRKRVEEALAASEREYRAILDSIPARVGIYDTSGKRISANRRAVELSGLPPDADWRKIFHPDDVGPAEKRWQECLKSEEPFECEHRGRMADGTYRWHAGRRVPMRDENGKVIRWYGVSYDIEDRKQAEQALAASERNLQLIIDTTPAMAWSARPDGSNEYLSKQYVEYIGLAPEQIAGWDSIQALHPDDLDRMEAFWRNLVASGMPGEGEARLRRHDGVYRWFLFRANPLLDDRGNVLKWYGVSTDIEDLKRAELALAASEQKLQLTIDTIPALAWSARPDGSADFFNQHYLDYMGLTSEQALDWGWTAAVHPDDMGRLALTWQAILASGMPGEAEARLRRKDGEYLWFLFRAHPLRDDDGNIIKWYGINTDIEDRKRSEESFRAIVETTPECVKVVARDGTVLRTNAAGAVMAGAPSVDAVIGQRFFDFVAPEHREKYREFHDRICAGQKGFLEFDLINALGVRRHMETHAAPLREGDGSIVQLGITRDMTARKRMEDALRRSEAFLAEGQQLARMGNFSWNIARGELIWSEQLYRIFEFEPDTAVTLDRVMASVHPEDRLLKEGMVERAKRGEGDFDFQYRIVMPDQSTKHLHSIAHLVRDREDEIEYIGTVLDITQRQLSEQALEKLRSELAQVTRIMSLGALTASIAHEVNQPLAGIITNAGTCLRMLATDPPNLEGARETARRTIRDGNRAAEVIGRLRSLFSRKAAVIEPVDLNDAVREVVALSWGDLQRRRVVLRTELTDQLPPVGGDRIQLQQVIMNLLRNAADAMESVEDRPRRLLIRTEGDLDDQVRLCIRDTGAGFGSQGTEKIFNAFYTTKSDGMGIGLSVSRSIVEGHGGRLWAETNEGPGATFFVSIPQYSGDEFPVQMSDLIHPSAASSARNAAEIS